MSDALRALLVEDSATDAKLIVRELAGCGRPVEHERVEDAEGLRGALATSRWHVVLSDWAMPRFSALAALAIVKESGQDIPFLIVSGTVGEEAAADAMRSGAHDYVLKDRLGRLVPAVLREVRESAARVALRDAQSRFDRLAESGIIGILTVDLNGSLLDANDAYLRMVGYTRDELRAGAIRWPDLTPPSQRPLIDRAVAQSLASGFAVPWEMELARKDGKRVPVLVGGATLDSSRTIAFAIDLSARKEAETGRRRAEEALSASEAQLRQSQKMEAVGRLAGGVAHDFNNVLSVILCYAEVILSGLAETDPLRDDIEEIRKAGSRAAALTRQLLLFSRQQVAEAKVLDLHELLTGLERMLTRILGEDVDLALVAPKAPGRVKADPSHVEQVIMNLVVNARDAMPTGGKLTIETANVTLADDYAESHVPAKAGEYVMLAVTDTGVGIDKDTQLRIFEPFFTTKEKGKGTGLGLSTVFGIVQQSGGHVWVYSELGVGTTFKVYLPRVGQEVAPLVTAATPTTLRGSETVLLVEDEEQVRTVVRSVLERNGYRVIVAANAGEALLTCETRGEPIDLLLTDVVMPIMSGPELARRLTAVRRGMKVLCMSGYTDDSIVRHGVLDDGVAFVQKPFTPVSLLRKVRDVLDGSGGPRDRSPSEPGPA
jgi:PAS domain S-box-containing protein